MAEETYSVWDKNERLADNMSLADAMIFVEALFHKSWAKPEGIFTIKRNKHKEVQTDQFTYEIE